MTKLIGKEWIDRFISQRNVNGLCETLDQVSKPFLNTVSSDVILGFFSFGASWMKAVGRTIGNSLNNRNRYSCLKDLWDDVTDRTKDIMEDDNVKNELAPFGLTSDSMRDYVRLTLALAAKTHQDSEANFKRYDKNGGVLRNDKSARSRWNINNRTYAKQILTEEKITIKQNNEEKTISWFDLLGMLDKLRGKMARFINSPEGAELWAEIVTHIKTENNENTIK